MRFFTLLFVPIFILCLLSPACLTASAEVSADFAASEYAESFLGSFSSADYQRLLDGFCAQNAGIGAEWLVLGLRQYINGLDYFLYRQSLNDYINSNSGIPPVTLLKYAFLLLATGEQQDATVKRLTQENIGKQGIMSYVFGLHLLNNGITCAQTDKQAVVQSILSVQHIDGGWALTASADAPVDADVTAMTLQALSVYYPSDADVRAAVDKAVAALSLMQQPDASFCSYGISNCESTAQVIIALTSLGVSPFDARFVKNGVTLTDALLGFRLSDGQFEHCLGGGAQLNAGLQAFNALVAVNRFQKAAEPFYILSDYTFASPHSTNLEPSANAFKPDWKFWFYIAVGCVCAVAVVILLVRKSPVTDYLLIAVVAAVLCCFVGFSKFESVQEHYLSSPPEGEIITVSLSIRCDTVVGIAQLAPDNGCIFSESNMQISQGSTVFDALCTAAKMGRLQMDYEGNSLYGNQYVKAINYFYQLEYGAYSGWVYAVNGQMQSVGCGRYVLSQGDSVCWAYSTQLGKDVNFEGVVYD